MTYVGLDVHARSTHAAAIDVASGELRRARFGGGADEVVEWLRGLPQPVRGCYEAGPTGFALYRAAEAAGLGVEVIAPSKTPRPSGDRVKTDRKDAELLARLLLAGQLKAVTVPPVAFEAARLRGGVVADGRAAALLPRHRHPDRAGALPRDRRLPPLPAARPARGLAWARALAQPVRCERDARADHQDRLQHRAQAAGRGCPALPAPTQRRCRTRPTTRRPAGRGAAGRAACPAPPAPALPSAPRARQARQHNHRRRAALARLIPLGPRRRVTANTLRRCLGGRRAERCRHARMIYGQPNRATPASRQRTPATQQGPGVANPRIIRLTHGTSPPRPTPTRAARPPRQRPGDTRCPLDKTRAISDQRRRLGRNRVQPGAALE